MFRIYNRFCVKINNFVTQMLIMRGIIDERVEIQDRYRDFWLFGITPCRYPSMTMYRFKNT